MQVSERQDAIAVTASAEVPAIAPKILRLILSREAFVLPGKVKAGQKKVQEHSCRKKFNLDILQPGSAVIDRSGEAYGNA